MTRLLTLVVTTVSILGCNKENPNPPGGPAGAPVEPGKAAVGVAAPAGAMERAYLTAVTGLRREASDAKTVDDASGKKLTNWQATLYRGEEVKVLEIKDDWAKVRASDDTEGWIKKDGLVPAEGVELATLLETAKVFSRPDLLALNSNRTLDPGSLLFIMKSKDQFTEVNFYGKNSAWVLSEKLNNDPTEVSASKLLNKVRWLKERKDPTADQVLELARSQFGSSRLVGMADEQGKPVDPSAAAGGAPAGDSGEATP